jgi:hypothetical protein
MPRTVIDEGAYSHHPRNSGGNSGGFEGVSVGNSAGCRGISVGFLGGALGGYKGKSGSFWGIRGISGGI